MPNSDAIQSDDASIHVLDGQSKKQILDGLNALRASLKSLGNQVELSISTAPFSVLKQGLLALKEQAPGVDAGSVETDDVASSTTLAAMADSLVDVRISGREYANLPDMIGKAEAIIQNRKDDELTRSFKKLKAAIAKAEQRCVKDESGAESGMLEYFALFVPCCKELETERASLLSRLFDYLLEILRKFATILRDTAKMTWDILKNPDAYYLRLRGELHEFQRKHPGQKWIEHLLVLPDLFRLYVRMLFDSRVAAQSKWQIFGAIAYLVAPIDLLPEAFVGPAGYTEDVFILAIALVDLVDSHRVSKALLLEHWSGTEATLDSVVRIFGTLGDKLKFFGAIRSWYKESQAGKPA